MNSDCPPHYALNASGREAINLAMPATVAPIERSTAGLPIGVQIVGPYLEDRTTIAFAGLLEREFGGFAPPPSMGG